MKEMEKDAEVEEEQSLLNDDGLLYGVAFSQLNLQRKNTRRCRLFPIFYPFVLICALLSFLSYEFLKPLEWRLLKDSRASSTLQEDESLAIRLNPSLHRHRPPQRISYDWTISTGIRAPDGVEKEVYLINGSTPISHSSVPQQPILNTH